MRLLPWMFTVSLGLGACSVGAEKSASNDAKSRVCWGASQATKAFLVARIDGKTPEEKAKGQVDYQFWADEVIEQVALTGDAAFMRTVSETTTGGRIVNLDQVDRVCEAQNILLVKPKDSPVR